MLRLIGQDERDKCTSLNNYISPSAIHMTEKKLFVPFDWCDMFIPLHNGACVYECYAELMKIHWTSVAKKALSYRGKDLTKSTVFVHFFVILCYIYIY